MLPVELGPAAEARAAARASRSARCCGSSRSPAIPAQRAEERESIELAFVAAVQHLPPNQRAALIMFDVLGFTAREIAEAMDTTPASVHSALQRARKVLEESLPERSQQATLAELGDAGQRELVARYTAALQRHDVEGMLALLTEDATWSMPPLASWFRGHAAIAALPRRCAVHRPLAPPPGARQRAARGGLLRLGRGRGAYHAYALDVLEVHGDRIAAVVALPRRRAVPGVRAAARRSRADAAGRRHWR